MSNFTFRPARPSDYAATEVVMRESFWNHYSPGCSEHYLLHIMRKSPNFVPQLDWVAECNGKIVGSIVYLKAHIEGDDGTNREVLSLGPIAVLPEFQKNGIGGELINHTREVARSMGFRAILLCGDPAYYGRQGFWPAESLGIRTSDDMYAVALHVCQLAEGALADARGRYVEDAIYEIDEAAVTEFDKNFPHKELVTGTPMQQRFLQIVAMRRKA